jgi:hypothetical protein
LVYYSRRYDVTICTFRSFTPAQGSAHPKQCKVLTCSNILLLMHLLSVNGSFLQYSFVFIYLFIYLVAHAECHIAPMHHYDLT